MAHGNVIRRTLAFPSANAGGGGGAASNAIPDPRSSGLPYAIASADAGTFDPAALSSYQAASRVIDIPAGTVAIGIAPDSLIHSCDLSLTGAPSNAIRIAPGLPLLGCRGELTGTVTLPTMPYGVAITSASVMPGMAGTFPLDGSDVAQWPLRLEFFIGGVAPIRNHRRAPMVVKARVVTSTSVDKLIYACVDGRRQIAITVAPTTADASITVTGIVGVPIALDDAGTTTATITAGTYRTYAVENAAPNTFALMQIRVTGAGAGTCYVDVRAED